jgi:hypothetical protein
MISEHEEQLLLTVTRAAKAAGVDRRTIRRRLDGGEFPHARRDAGSQGPESGPWLIPVGDLVGAGLTVHDPTGVDEAADLESARAQVDALRAALADTVRRAEVAEARAAERERVIAAQELALRALAPDPTTAGPGDTGPVDTDPVDTGPVDTDQQGGGAPRDVGNPRPGRGPVAPDSGDPVLQELRDAYRPPAASPERDRSEDGTGTGTDVGDDRVSDGVPPPVSPYPETELRPAPTFSPGAPSKPTPPWVPIEQPPQRRRQRRP